MVCSELFPNLYRDESAKRIIDQIDYDFSALKKKAKNTMYRFGYLEVAMRQNDLEYEIKDYLNSHPSASIVNLGCGLDDTGRKCDNGTCKIYNLDFPDVIKVRNSLLPPKEKEENIDCDINDTSWFKKIDSTNGVVLFAAGVFYYFLTEQVKQLVKQMALSFPDGKLVFDAANKKAGKLLRKTWLKALKIKDVEAYFSINSPFFAFEIYFSIKEICVTFLSNSFSKFIFCFSNIFRRLWSPFKTSLISNNGTSNLRNSTILSNSLS